MIEVVCITNREIRKPLSEEAIVECIEEIARKTGGYMMLEIEDKLGIKDKQVVYADIGVDEIIEEIYKSRRRVKEWRDKIRAWMTKKILKRLGIDETDEEWLEKYNELFKSLGEYEEMLSEKR